MCLSVIGTIMSSCIVSIGSELKSNRSAENIHFAANKVKKDTAVLLIIITMQLPAADEWWASAVRAVGSSMTMCPC